ncbi:hypothetical protein [Streptomyces cucumeris]|uniref:hypothetical protein n=1 Tax=Streptomyces cucumeris TaxID=2962890 RepID=UPI003D70DF33
MGYRKTTRRVQVSLRGHAEYGTEAEFPEAVARGKTLDEYLRIMGWTEDEGDERTAIVRQLEEFADSLISWNLEDEAGAPLPCTRDAFFGIDNDLALAMATAWLDALGGKVDESSPLPGSSPSGEPSPVELVPMEALSGHQPPTSVPA